MLYTETLNQNKDFLALYKRGKCVPMRHIVLYARRNRLGVNRLGITAGKKVGNAVCRNRAKRMIRQAYRETEALLPRGLDLVIVARASITEEKTQAVTAQLQGRGLKQLCALVKGTTEPEART